MQTKPGNISHPARLEEHGCTRFSRAVFVRKREKPMQESMIFYKSFLDGVKQLPKENQLEALLAILEYAFTEEEQEPEGLAKIPYLMAKPQIDANIKRKNDGTKGGRPKTSGFENKKPVVMENKNHRFSEKKPVVSETENHTLQNQKPNYNVNDNENENSNANENERDARAHTHEEHEEPKKTYGLYNNVRLTDGEMQALMDNYPDDYPNMIENLSAYMKEKGKFYADHYATMTRWRREDEARKKEQEPPKKKPLDVYDFFISSALKA